jgi:hypothetical protein
MITVQASRPAKQWWDDVMQGEYLDWSEAHKEMGTPYETGCCNKEILGSNGRCRGKCCCYRLSENHTHCNGCDEIMCPTVRGLLEKREARNAKV